MKASVRETKSLRTRKIPPNTPVEPEDVPEEPVPLVVPEEPPLVVPDDAPLVVPDEPPLVVPLEDDSPLVPLDDAPLDGMRGWGPTHM